MFYVKRFAVLAILLALIGGYFWYDNYTRTKEAAEADRTALATAEVWVASARFGHDPARYIHARDSILADFGLEAGSMTDYLKIYESAPEQYAYFVSRVRFYVDSMATLQESLYRAGDFESDSVTDSIDQP